MGVGLNFDRESGSDWMNSWAGRRGRGGDDSQQDSTGDSLGREGKIGLAMKEKSGGYVAEFSRAQERNSLGAGMNSTVQWRGGVTARG